MVDSWEALLGAPGMANLDAVSLGCTLASLPIAAAEEMLSSGRRTECLSRLKDIGVEKLTTRQALVNALSAALRQRKASGESGASTIADPPPSSSPLLAQASRSSMAPAPDATAMVAGMHEMGGAGLGEPPRPKSDGAPGSDALRRIAPTDLSRGLLHVLENGLTPMLKRMRSAGIVLRHVLDIGACHGTWTREARRVFPEATYDMIEPIEYTELAELARGEPKLRVHHCLLFSKAADVEWHERRNTGDSIFRERTAHYRDVRPATRRATTLGALFDDRVPPLGEGFDLIKLDVQGAEVEVMRGGEALMRAAQFVMLELPFAGQYNERAPSFLEVVTYMDSLGFVPYDLPEMHREGGVLLQIDIMFAAKNHPLLRRCQATIDNLGLSTSHARGNECA